ncbi:MAG: HAMP domain-containing histidine kinase [Piscinibacter sp.]|nr:HAMP domain-containing histidine kinase [Piscinibacter sp.]
MKRHARRWRRSLGARLVLMFLLLALAVAATFVIGAQSMLRGGWQGYAVPLTADYVDRLAAEIGTPPDLARAQALAQRLPLRIRIDGPVLHWDSQPQPERRFGRPGPDGHDASPWHPARTLADGHRIAFSLAELGPQARTRHAGWVTLTALLLLTALAYAYTRHLLRPLGEIRAGAQRYGGGDFGQPIVVHRRDELGVLAEQINAMAAGLRDRLDAKRALLLAISHELRSPLTRARVNAELVADGPERDALLRDLGQMRDLIAELLDSERLAGGHEALHREPTDVNALARDLVAEHFDAAPIALRLAPGLPSAAVDRPRIRMLLRNLLDNALRHQPPQAAPVELRSTAERGEIRLVVRDHGPGVPPDQLAQLGEAFHRTDAARQRETGGVGLGLTLCRLVAQAHGGQIEFRNGAPGLEVTVRLPLA